MVCYTCNTTALSTSKWKIEAELWPLVPGAIARLIGKLAWFASEVINRLPDWLRRNITIDNVYVSGKTLVMLVTIVETAEVKAAVIGWTSVMIAAIIAVALLAGLFIWRVTTTEIATGKEVIRSCEKMLRDGLIDQEGYLQCLGIVKQIQQQALYKFLILAGAAVLVGGGFLLLKARR